MAKKSKGKAKGANFEGGYNTVVADGSALSVKKTVKGKGKKKKGY